MQQPKLLLFDIGGVLVENTGFGSLNRHLASGMPEAEIKSLWLSSPAVRAFELGITCPAVFAASFVEEWRIPIEPAAFLLEFSSWPKGFYPGAVELLARLRRQFKLACLSNSNVLHWERFGGFTHHFDIALSSHILGAIKPDIQSFERATQECGEAAEDVAFFDDSLENVVAARECGMQAFHVCGLKQLERTLREAGWLQ